jgi:hypothetical protein
MRQTPITLSDYQRAVEGFVTGIRRIGGRLVSILLYGSVARGDLRPGHSDLMDAYVILRPETFEHKEEFLSALGIMVDSCAELSRSGIPFHPFHYFSQDEINSLPAIYLPTWSSDKSSKVLWGADVRSHISSTASSRAVAMQSFFEARRVMGHSLSRYFNMPELTQADCERIAHNLMSLKKHITILACLSLDIWVEASQAVPRLREALPHLDMSVLKKIDSFRDVPAEHFNSEDLRDTIRTMLIFVEELRDQLQGLRCEN